MRQCLSIEHGFAPAANGQALRYERLDQSDRIGTIRDDSAVMITLDEPETLSTQGAQYEAGSADPRMDGDCADRVILREEYRVPTRFEAIHRQFVLTLDGIEQIGVAARKRRHDTGRPPGQLGRRR
jgi:hypothetical protein